MSYSNLGPRSQESPALQAVAVTPHDTNSISTQMVRGVYVGGAGNVVVRLEGDQSTVTFTAVPAGTILPIHAEVITTASTATNMVALI